MPAQPSASQEIAHGTSRTKSNGTFDLQFTAKPDLSIAEESEPTFRFTIYADVTDSTGETRSAQRVVNVGYTALAASLSAETLADGQRSGDSIAVRTTTLDGEGQAAKGVLKVYSLKQPDRSCSRAVSAGRYRGTGEDRSTTRRSPIPANRTLGSWAKLVFRASVETNACRRRPR